MSPRSLFGGIAIASLTVGVIAVTNTLYKFFDLFPQSIYYYLFTDVIPHELMGRFTSLIRVCSTAGSFVFNLFLLKYCRDYPGAICVGAAVLYLVTFALLCLIVKEGEYPPPEPREDRGIGRVTEDIAIYVRECFSLTVLLEDLFLLVLLHGRIRALRRVPHSIRDRGSEDSAGDIRKDHVGARFSPDPDLSGDGADCRSDSSGAQRVLSDSF